MTLIDILLLVIIIAIALQFWKLREMAEAAQAYLRHYCQTNKLQLISVARVKTRLTTHAGKLTWRVDYAFEFSGNGEDRYNGTVTLANNRVAAIDLPAYKIN